MVILVNLLLHKMIAIIILSNKGVQSSTVAGPLGVGLGKQADLGSSPASFPFSSKGVVSLRRLVTLPPTINETFKRLVHTAAHLYTESFWF